jgi:hypothetical protein
MKLDTQHMVFAMGPGGCDMSESLTMAPSRVLLQTADHPDVIIQGDMPGTRNALAKTTFTSSFVEGQLTTKLPSDATNSVKFGTDSMYVLVLENFRLPHDIPAVGKLNLKCGELKEWNELCPEFGKCDTKEVGLGELGETLFLRVGGTQYADVAAGRQQLAVEFNLDLDVVAQSSDSEHKSIGLLRSHPTEVWTSDSSFQEAEARTTKAAQKLNATLMRNAQTGHQELEIRSQSRIISITYVV